MNDPTTRKADDESILTDLGGESLTQSGFENEPPDSDFAEAEANESDGQ
jgi:hypothetical protein